MALSVGVGSVLGGRYKVTARILESAEHDCVLDGVDQVLNRPVSILVAAPENSAHLGQGAREVATGERHAALQILDLGTSEGTTYLITNQSPAPDLLDLLVPTEPYTEPFFTDTLGQEIFGVARDDVPGRQDYDYVYEDNTPVPADLTPHAEPARAVPAPPARAGADTSRPGPSAKAAVPAPPAAPPSSSSNTPVPTGRPAPSASHATPPTTAQPASPSNAEQKPTPPTTAVPPVPEASTSAGSGSAAQPRPPKSGPKVSLWSDEDYGFINDDHEHGRRLQPDGRAAAAESHSSRKPRTFPLAARENEGPAPVEDYDDDDNTPRTGSRLLVGAVVAAIIVAALIFAVTQISSLVGGQPAAAPSASHSASQVSSAPSPSASASPTAAPVIPQITGVTRLVGGGDPNLYAVNDPQLPKTFDGNPATTWSTFEFSNDTFANQTSYIALAVALKEKSDIKTVTITQLGGTGGSFQLLSNTSAAVDGGTEIGTGSFTGQDITVNVPAGTKSQYVIIKFTQLPKLTSFRTYPYGIKVAEISIK